MKNRIKGLLGLAFMVVANLGFANDIYFNVDVLDEDRFKLSVLNVNGDASLFVFDTTGKELYEETVSNVSSFEKIFDLSELPDGKYIFKYEDDFKVQTVTFIVSDQLTFHLASSEINFVPVISQRGSEIAVSLVTNSKERLMISVYDQEGNLLVKDIIEGEKYFGKKFDFSKVEKGSYSVVVSNGDRSVRKLIEIK